MVCGISILVNGTIGEIQIPAKTADVLEWIRKKYKNTNIQFQGKLQDGILRFGELGPKDPAHIGVSAGPGRIIFCGQKVTDAWQNYAEPDYIHLISPACRYRTTLLYRHGEAVRTLVAHGSRLSPDPSLRYYTDPRGRDGPVHEALKATQVFKSSPMET